MPRPSAVATAFIVILLTACTFQPAALTPPPVSPLSPATTAAPQGGVQSETEPGEEEAEPSATEEIAPPSEQDTDSLWEARVPQSGDLLLWYALPPQTPVDLAFNRLVDDFNAQNAYGLTVYAFNLSTPQEVLSRTLPLLGTPDVPALISLAPEQQSAYEDALLPLDDLLRSSTWGIPFEERTTWTDVFFQAGSVMPEEESGLFALPAGTDAYGLTLNMDWIARLGSYESPSDPEAFAALTCKAASRPYKIAGEVNGYAFVPSLESLRAWTQVFGGNLYDADIGAYRFDQPATRQALSFLQDLYAQGCITLAENETAAQDAFREGETLLILNPVSTLHPANRWHQELSFNWQVDTLPGGTLVLAPGLRLAIPHSTPERELAAWLFLRYALGTPAQTQFAAESAWFPLQAQAAAQSGLPPRYGRLYKAALLSPSYGAVSLPPAAKTRLASTLSDVLRGASVSASLQSLQQAIGEP